jgi:hypothetical protein
MEKAKIRTTIPISMQITAHPKRRYDFKCRCQFGSDFAGKYRRYKQKYPKKLERSERKVPPGKKVKFHLLFRFRCGLRLIPREDMTKDVSANFQAITFVNTGDTSKSIQKNLKEANEKG